MHHKEVQLSQHVAATTYDMLSVTTISQCRYHRCTFSISFGLHGMSNALLQNAGILIYTTARDVACLPLDCHKHFSKNKMEL